jgi:hypothetical protein
MAKAGKIFTTNRWVQSGGKESMSTKHRESYTQFPAAMGRFMPNQPETENDQPKINEYRET